MVLFQSLLLRLFLLPLPLQHVGYPQKALLGPHLVIFTASVMTFLQMSDFYV